MSLEVADELPVLMISDIPGVRVNLYLHVVAISRDMRAIRANHLGTGLWNRYNPCKITVGQVRNLPETRQVQKRGRLQTGCKPAHGVIYDKERIAWRR